MPGPLTKPTLAQRLTPHLQPQRVVGGFALSLLGGIVQPFAWSLLLVFLSLVGFCIWSLRSAEEAAKLPPLVDGEGRPLSAEPRAIVLPNDPGSPQPTAAPPEPPKPSWQPSPRVRTTALVLAILCLLASIPFAVGAVQSKDSIFQRTYAKLVDVEEAVDDVQDGVEHLQEDTEGIKADTEDIKADLAALREALKAATPTDDGSLSPDSEGDAEILDRALLRLAEDAQRGVETARRALEDASPEEAGDYFMDQLAKLDAGRDAIEARLDEEEVELSREAAEVLFRTGRIDDAEAALQRILARLPDDLDATNRLGHVYQLRGDYPAAEGRYRRLLELAPEEPAWRATALGNLGLIAQIRRDLDEAERLHRESLEINRTLGRLKGQANQLGNLGVIARNRRDLDQAERLLRESLEINRTLVRLEGQAVALGNLGLIAWNRGDLDQAERL
ncbi:MAG: tetratricopeptide repeat protein, partial [Planctomycetota bacterium]